MAIASLLWQAGQHATGRPEWSSAEWMKDPAAYRQAFAVAFSVFAQMSMPVRTDAEKEHLCEAFCDQLINMKWGSDK
jgi:hypothetical protein